MIYQGTDVDSSTMNDQIDTSPFNESDDASYYVGLKYTQNEQHGQSVKSTILNELDLWYNNNLSDVSVYIDSNIGFCNDRNAASGDTWSVDGSFSYAPYERLNGNSIPNLNCDNRADILKIPIGLINVDEVVFAGLLYLKGNSNNYLNSNRSYWTMSSSRFTSLALQFYVSGSFIFDITVTSNHGVRPVINLKADTFFTGEGTKDNPFTVVMNKDE